MQHNSDSTNAEVDDHAVWQAWRAQAKPSRVELLSEDKIDPIVQAHMTLTPALQEESRFSFLLHECHLDGDEWEQHCIRSDSMDFDNTGGLALVPLRRSSHT